MRYAVARLVAACALVAAGCSGPLPLDDVPLGVAESVEQSAPGFVVEASPVVVDGELRLEVRAAVTPADLVFSGDDLGHLADISLAFRVMDRQGRHTLGSRDLRDSIRVASVADTRSDQKLVRTETFDVPPGRLIAEAVLRDARGGARAVRRVEAEMPRSDEPSILPLRLVRAGDYAIGARMPQWRLEDSVRVVTATTDPGIELTLSLVRGRSDRTVPTPPFWIGPPRGSLVYRGATFDESEGDTMMVVTSASAGIELPLVEEGVYLLAAAFSDQNQRRPLIVLPAGHPRVDTIDGLIDALAYIAYPSEIEQMRDGASAGERRRRFDAFWASLFDVRQLAEQTMRLYFTRVEEANRQFTTHKPGWMSDRGMLYVVLGPPETVERTLDGEVWRYGSRHASAAYFFERVPYTGSPWPMEHHVLHRAPRYETDWQRAVSRWRRGEVR